MNLMESIFETTTTTSTITPGNFFLCLAVSLILGGVIALGFTFRSRSTKSFVLTLILLPAVITVVIMMVNGNIGAGVAVMGAFSLVRFRSAQGSAREICSLFLSMAVGLATGMGYIWIAVAVTVLLVAVAVIFSLVHPGAEGKDLQVLRITIPEALNYTEVFDEIFEAYTKSYKLLRVKTTNMGSLYKLEYEIDLKNPKEQKAMIDALRCRNGNLEIACSYRDDAEYAQVL